MKVLFISTLRIGDFFMHLNIADAFRNKYPHAEIHFLVNDVIPDEVHQLVPYITIHNFSRLHFQELINTVEAPLLYPFWKLKDLIISLNEQAFTHIYDLSFQRLSTKLLNLISAEEKSGVLNWDPLEIKGSSFIKSLITKMHDKADSSHYLDLLKRIVGVELTPAPAIKRDANRILFQVSTSDPKKNYDLYKWKVIIDSLVSKYNNSEFKILCSRTELNKLSKYFPLSYIQVADFRYLAQIFPETSLLVSLDTSIKHFAARYGTPTLELSIGSSHPLKTSAYQEDNYILSAQMTCRPCEHSLNCRYERNKCQDDINPARIIDFVDCWLQGANKNNMNDDYDYKTIIERDNLGFIQKKENKWKMINDKMIST